MSAGGKPTLRRVPTGVGPLDELLGGGLPAYAVVVLAGEPGTGKTILSQQVLFANAHQGGKGLYLTTVSESPMKTARYQSEFSFFDPDRFGESVVYMDIGETIRREKLGRSVEIVGAALREHEPNMVVIDSFKAIHDLAASMQETRTFAYDLAIELSAVQATTLLVGEYELGDIGRAPEFAVADGIIWLSLEKTEALTRRHLRILKMRGVAHPTRAFSFDIGSDGLIIHALPRLGPPPRMQLKERLQTGVPGLDSLLRGGIPAGYPILISGESGAGKSTLCIQFLFRGAADHGDGGVYFSYEEPPEQIIANARGFGWDLEPLIERGLLRIVHAPLPEVNPEAEIVRMKAIIDELGARRAVVDSLTMLLDHIEQADIVRGHVYDLATMFKAAGCTALITTDPPAASGLISRFGVEESILDGVILLKTAHENRERKRFLEVFKLRGIGHVSGDNLMKIGSDGVRVFVRAEEAAR